LNDPLTNIEIVQEGYEPVVPIVVEPEVVMEGYEPVVPTDSKLFQSPAFYNLLHFSC
jgi:hypothetical protein